MADIESKEAPVQESTASTPIEDPQTETSPEVEVIDSPVGKMGKPKSEGWVKKQWTEYGQQMLEYLGKLDYLGDFFAKYQGPITTLILIVAAFVGVKVTLAAIDAINDIPLLSPLFELIGIGYSAWFVWRYLARASTRKELIEDIKALGEQVTGGKEPKG